MYVLVTFHAFTVYATYLCSVSKEYNTTECAVVEI